jgi:hypothetical protein
MGEFCMFRSDKGQTVLEYLILATIIMVSIVVGGPFLARSVSGHFRLLEDSASDSIGEDIRQAPIPPQPPGGCTCDPWFRSAVCGMDPCTPSQRLYQRSCGICGMEQECRSELDCCNDPEPVICGQNLNVNGSCDSGRVLPMVPADPANPTGPQVNVFDSQYIGVCPGNWANNDARKCKIGERLYSITCGAATPSNPAASSTYYACKNVTDNKCAPECWDASNSNGTPVPNSEECTPGEETNFNYLPEEIVYRNAGFNYNGTTYTDMPTRPTSANLSASDRERYGALRVINTYFNQDYAHLDPYANQCAPGDPGGGYGTDRCHRCHPSSSGSDPLNRRCEFVCPAGLYPAPRTINGITYKDVACDPCSAGETKISIAYTPCGDCGIAIQYIPPEVSSLTDFHMIAKGKMQNFLLGCINNTGWITDEISNFGQTAFDSQFEWNSSSCPNEDTPRITLQRYHCGGGFINAEATFFGYTYYTIIRGDGAHSRGDRSYETELTCRNGHRAIMSLIHTHRCGDGGCGCCESTEQKTMHMDNRYLNPDFKICTPTTLNVTMKTSRNGSLYALDSSNNPGALMAHVENDAQNANSNSVSVLIPEDDSGETTVFVTNIDDTAKFYQGDAGASGSDRPSNYNGYPALQNSNVTLSSSATCCVLNAVGGTCIEDCTDILLNPNDTKPVKFTFRQDCNCSPTWGTCYPTNSATCVNGDPGTQTRMCTPPQFGGQPCSSSDTQQSCTVTCTDCWECMTPGNPGGCSDWDTGGCTYMGDYPGAPCPMYFCPPTPPLQVYSPVDQGGCTQLPGGPFVSCPPS